MAEYPLSAVRTSDGTCLLTGSEQQGLGERLWPAHFRIPAALNRGPDKADTVTGEMGCRQGEALGLQNQTEVALLILQPFSLNLLNA